MPDISTGRKVLYFAILIVNAAIDLLLPTLVLVVLAPLGVPAAVALTIGGTLLTGKAIGGRIETGEFRWRLAVIAAGVATATIVGCYLAGFGNVPSMVAGAVVSGVIVIGDLVVTRVRHKTASRLDGFAVGVLLEVAASVVLTSVSGDARFVLARPAIYIAIAGAVILATTWAQRPIMRTALKPVASQGDPIRAEAFELAWQHSRQFRGLYRAMTASLGLVFLVDAVLQVVIIYSRPASAVVQSSFTSQVPLFVLVALWFVVGRFLIVPRTLRLLEAELPNVPEAPPVQLPGTSSPLAGH
ncbi:VC0807 family protein [Fodinicola feengrottensis]|uniref:MFS transporter n=1 Tax=Fodinicola feengrottensis TaxID=435914 RepID=A0ABP4SWS6_9ACTN|nr:VC0807 family protein [Fodinicola feengrottensis]